MADSFEKWMERQIKLNRVNGATINCEDLNNVWTALQSEALKEYERRRFVDGTITIATRIENGEKILITTNQEGYINNFLEHRFFMEFLAIKKHFTEYYTLFGLFDRPYFNRLLNDFRKLFKEDQRAPGIKYFDDLIEEFIKDYEPAQKTINEFTLEEIALIYVYNGETVTRENCEEKASVYRHDGGAKLYQHFTFYSSKRNRRSKPDKETEATLRKKIERFEKVIPCIIDENGIEQIKEDIKVLEERYSADYE